jgi:YVTN family beta-propeller protein
VSDYDPNGRPRRADPSARRRAATPRSGAQPYVSPYDRSTPPGGGPRSGRGRGGGRGGRPPGNPARALGPRSAVTTIGRRRRSPGPAILLGAVLVLVAGIALTWWILTRPAAVALTTDPPDAIITFAKSRPTTGTFEAEELEPGRYKVTVERVGFEPVATTLVLQRGRTLEKRFVMKPLPFEMKFTTRPAGAAVTVTRGDDEPITGRAPCTLVVPAGEISVSVTKAGTNPFEKTLFLDAAQVFDVILDPEGQIVHALGSVVCGGAPKGVALTPDGKQAWSAILNGPPSIQIFEPISGRTLGDIDLGKAGAVEVIFNRAGTRAYASQMEKVLGQTSRVFEIDVATHEVLRTFDTKSTMTKVIALSPDEKTLYSANWAGNDVSFIDLATGRVRKRIAVAKTPRGLWPTGDGKSLYVASFGTGELQRIDLATSKVTTLFKSGGAMRHLVADEKAGRLYASDMGKDAIYVLDMKTDAVTKLASTDHKPNTIDLSPDGKVLFVSNRGANNPKSYYIAGYEWGTVLLLDAATGKPLDAIVGGNQCTALDVSEDGTLLVFSDFLDDRLRVYSVPAYSVLAAGKGGRYEAHFADLKKKTPGKTASTGASD